LENSKVKDVIVMSYGYLPLPAYLSLIIILCILLMYFAIKRRYIDRKGLIVLYVTLAMWILVAGVIRLIKETTNLYNKYFDKIGIILLGFIVILLVEFLYLSITHKGNEKSRRLILLGWVVIVVPIIISLLVFRIFE
jgi:hypothetical protein